MTKMSHSRLRPLSPTVFLSSAKLASTFLRCSIEKCGSFLSHNLSVENCGQKRPKSEAKTTAILKVDAPAWGVMAHVPKTGKFMQAFPKAGICCAFADYTFGARAVCRPINGRGCAEISDGVAMPGRRENAWAAQFTAAKCKHFRNPRRRSTCRGTIAWRACCVATTTILFVRIFLQHSMNC